MKLFSKNSNSNLCDDNPPTLQTDRQTTCDRNTALCTKVHRAVKRHHTVIELNVDLLYYTVLVGSGKELRTDQESRSTELSGLLQGLLGYHYLLIYFKMFKSST